MNAHAPAADWRLSVEFESAAHARRLLSGLKTHAAAALAADRLKTAVFVEHDAQWLRVYADSRDALGHAREVVAGVISLWELRAQELAEHRAGETGEWERIELPPLPQGEQPGIAEHHGSGPWGAEANPDHRVQVHFELASHHDAIAYAKTLAEAGYDVHQHESFVFLFADDPDSAHQLGEVLREHAPPGAQLFYEGETGKTLFF